MSAPYAGKHRAPANALTLVQDLFALTHPYEATFARHIKDGRTPDDALELALIDADDAMNAWEATS